jgi:hypothetical protein
VGAGEEVVSAGVLTPAAAATVVSATAAGGVIGATVGDKITNHLFSADAGHGRGGNRVPNSEVQRLYKNWNLNEAGQDYVHEQIQDQGLKIDEIEDIKKEAANHEKFEFLTNPGTP